MPGDSSVTLYDGCYLVGLLTVHCIGPLCYFLCDWAANRKAECFMVAAVPYAVEHPGWRSVPGRGRCSWQQLTSRQVHLKLLITWDPPCTYVLLLVYFDEWQLSCT